MANILFLAHRIPYPPNKGDKIRSWHFLSHLFSKHNVHLGFFVDSQQDLEHVPYLRGLVSSLCFETTSPFFQKVRSLKALGKGTSLTEEAYPFRKLRSYTRKLIARGEIDLIFLFSAATADILPRDCMIPIVSDLVDVDSEKWASYAEGASWPLSWLYRREAEKLGAFEASVASLSRATLLVSAQEAELFVSLNPEQHEKTHAVANGVDFKSFDASVNGKDTGDNLVLFTGAMDYQPNIEAVAWFCAEIWPLVLAQRPTARFRIAGGPLTSRVRALAAIPGVEVAGYVPDMAVEISKACICVAPLKTARGIQNKVLEAMAMAKPVVATQLANEGVNAQDGETIYVRDTARAFADAVILLLDNKKLGKKLGQRALEFVAKEFTWDAAYRQLDALIEAEL